MKLLKFTIRSEDSLPDYLSKMVLLKEQFANGSIGGYSCIESFLLKQGRQMNYKRGRPVRMMPVKQCYRNCFQAAIRSRGALIYCEGIASNGIIPIDHAWLIDEQGQTIDPTWTTPGLEYWGVAFNPDYLRRTIRKKECYSWLSMADSETVRVLDAHPKEWRHPIMDKLKKSDL